jgi:hypothetical protein
MVMMEMLLSLLLVAHHGTDDLSIGPPIIGKKDKQADRQTDRRTLRPGDET